MPRVTIAQGHIPAQDTVLGWNVPDITVAAADLVKADYSGSAKLYNTPAEETATYCLPSTV